MWDKSDSRGHSELWSHLALWCIEWTELGFMFFTLFNHCLVSEGTIHHFKKVSSSQFIEYSQDLSPALYLQYIELVSSSLFTALDLYPALINSVGLVSIYLLTILGLVSSSLSTVLDLSPARYLQYWICLVHISWSIALYLQYWTCLQLFIYTVLDLSCPERLVYTLFTVLDLSLALYLQIPCTWVSIYALGK
jgi:hypothetical protein